MPHIHELYDFTVGLIIVHDSRALFINHPRYNKWLMPGGHVELNEDPEQALYREAEEETGLPVRLIAQYANVVPGDGVKLLPQPLFMDSHDANPPHKHIGLNYLLMAEHDKVQLSDEHLDYAWLDTSALEGERYGLDPTIKFYAAEGIRIASQQQ